MKRSSISSKFYVHFLSVNEKNTWLNDKHNDNENSDNSFNEMRKIAAMINVLRSDRSNNSVVLAYTKSFLTDKLYFAIDFA